MLEDIKAILKEIFFLNNDVVPILMGRRAATRAAPTNLSNILGVFKSITTVEYIKGVKKNNWCSFDGKLWQRTYYEHVVRNEESLYKAQEYIINNPKKWPKDKINPVNYRGI